MNTAFRHYIEPSYIPDESMLYTGANPCWTPAREGRVPGPARKVEAQDKLTCDVCGGYLAADAGRDPLLPDGEMVKVSIRHRSVKTRAVEFIHACGGCTRTNSDGTRAMERAGEPVSHENTDRSDTADRTGAAVERPAVPALTLGGRAVAGGTGATGRPKQLGFLKATTPGERKASPRPGNRRG